MPDPVRALSYASIGLAPITALALSVFELVPLHLGGPGLVSGAIGLGLWLQVLAPGSGWAVLRGLLAGLVAVLIYDCARLPFVLFGNWPDFIPMIGAWLLDKPAAHWSLGYGWRYLGNGAGMGLAFAMLAPFTRRWVGQRQAGFLYGVAIWSGLIVTLLLAPGGQDKLFRLNLATLAASLIGHLVYGGVLGWITPTEVTHQETSSAQRRHRLGW